ncbi:oxygen-independent coproporphyrinogen III oxidase [Foetidibacter luteolus]|uniref:oxygen-independent coproporphyrinogen III oxidase n=1 Tax=Foetidibacter luteolus TaxID=2608880 RepID=UPI001A987036|nr:oxygen-independent coproporphyrinogen III oxidase [Foetidibacter luteolus]
MNNSLLPDMRLVKKYNTPVPRYTSYPTVPYWNGQVDITAWQQRLTKSFSASNTVNGISLYIHLPFCESLCTYCGCNKKITANHQVESAYLHALEKEWSLYLRLLGSTPVIRELHLGGGTPTFFSPENLGRLMEMLLEKSAIHPMHEFSVEGHPNNTTLAHLQVLYKYGFRRISYGVQDLDEKVQQAINRVQPFSNVQHGVQIAKKAGFTSVNFDLIYGLPLQTQQSIENTMRQVLQLKPERIAFYSYAHIPWKSRGQRLFDESHLPAAGEKLQLYLTGRQMLLAGGYTDIGMDHFALAGDALHTAYLNGRLHRNFMGYTTSHTEMLIGLGVSAISDCGIGYAQNEKQLQDYYRQVNSGQLAIKKGYLLNREDIALRQYILDIICKGRTQFAEDDLPLLNKYCFNHLEALAADGLVQYNQTGAAVTEAGHYFLRNICRAFDVTAERNSLQSNIFSKAI